jgi:hypothetical protein
MEDGSWVELDVIDWLHESEWPLSHKYNIQELRDERERQRWEERQRSAEAGYVPDSYDEVPF